MIENTSCGLLAHMVESYCYKEVRSKRLLMQILWACGASYIPVLIVWTIPKTPSEEKLLCGLAEDQ